MSAPFADQHPVRGLLRVVMRLPILLYRMHMGWMFGDRLVLLTTQGRKTGLPRQAVVEVVYHDKARGTYIVASGWGVKSDWFRNLEKNPKVKLTLGVHQYDATASTISQEEAEQVLREYGRRHPIESRLMTRIFLGEDHPDPAEQSKAMAGSYPLVALRPENL